ncbi:MAG: MFS transporter [Defluviitaleaceae bacterium]|nr:MFS transporter [Defluviitaleaceae bacterium]
MSKLLAKNKNFKSFLLFASFFNIGRGIFTIFMLWVIHALYQNPVYTGVAGFMLAAPTIASFIAGPFVDRWRKVILLRVVCLVQFGVVALILGITLLTQASPWFLLFAILVFSIMGVFGAAAVTALVPSIVSGEDLVKANVAMQMAGTIGGLVIGVVLYVLMARGAGFELVYGVNAGVLLVGLLFSARLGTGALQEAGRETGKAAFSTYFAELKEGLSIINKGVLLPLIIALTIMGLFGNAAHVNLPLFAEVHIGTASGYILLSALALVGGVIGSYIGGIVGPKLELSKIFMLCFIGAGVVRILFVYVIPDNFVRALLIFVLYAGLAGTINIFFNTLVQKLPPQHAIGRITTLNASLFGIAAAIGALVGGLAGELLPNVDTVFIIQGASYIVIGLCLYLSKRVRALPKISDIGVSI